MCAIYRGSCPRELLHLSKDRLANSCFSVTTAHFCVFFPFPPDRWDVFLQILSCICWCKAAGGEAERSLPLLDLPEGSGKLGSCLGGVGTMVAWPAWSPTSCRWHGLLLPNSYGLFAINHLPGGICGFGVTAPKPLILTSLGCRCAAGFQSRTAFWERLLPWEQRVGLQLSASPAVPHSSCLL